MVCLPKFRIFHFFFASPSHLIIIATIPIPNSKLVEYSNKNRKHRSIFMHLPVVDRSTLLELSPILLSFVRLLYLYCSK